MELDYAIDLSRSALIVTLKLAVPLLATGLIAGLVVSLFQAVTQIQEQTLAFIPKMLVVVLTLIIMMPLLLTWSVEYTREMFRSLRTLWGG